MTYLVLLRPAAQRQLAKLRGPVSIAVHGALLSLAEDPRPRGDLKLTGCANLWRLRLAIDGVGWRVIYQVDEQLREDIEDMLEEVRFTRLLRGFRGSVAYEQGVRETLMRLSQLLQICPEIQEMDINPLKVLPSEVVAVDTRVRVAVPERLASRRIAY